MTNIVQDTIYLDIGSSTVKIYKYSNEVLSLLQTISLPFKDGFSESVGINPNNRDILYKLVNTLKSLCPNDQIKIYATALFRSMSVDAQQSFVDDFFKQTEITFNIISQEAENYYLEMALVGKYDSNDAVLLINIGGGSTELVVMQGKSAIEKHNLKLGVGTILKEYPSINSTYSQIPLLELVGNIEHRLPILHSSPDKAFYTGGELNYMTIANYRLRENTYFNDANHPKFITDIDFFNYNEEIFTKFTVTELQTLMLDNPRWMLGARACSAIAQAIVSKYNIKVIFPSDTNLIDGVVRSLIDGASTQ